MFIELVLYTNHCLISNSCANRGSSIELIYFGVGYVLTFGLHRRDAGVFWL